MKKYEYSRTLEPLYYGILPNGLTLCVIPKNNKSNFYAVLGVKYGSIDTEFIPYNKDEYIKTNYGIAHYLEHVAFAMEDTEDPFSFFAKTGTGANASTTFSSTKYYIWGVEEFEKNLDYLLTYVCTPYFTDSIIERERGIINEEIRMYEDDSNWIIDDLGRRMTFHELPVREKISGNYESVSKITKEELYDCYNTFYVPNNMFLVVSGNVSKDKVLEVVNNNKALNKLKANYNIKRKKYDEPSIVEDEYKEIKINVYLPKAKYIFKFKRSDFTMKETVKLNMYINMIISIVFGPTSEFYEKTRESDIVNSYYVDCTRYEDFYSLEFTIETDKADIFKDLVDEYFENIKISSEEFERIKKVWIASEIRISDSEDILAENTLDDILTYGNICPNRIDIIESLNMKGLNKVLKELNLDNSCFILVNPKEENN